MSIRIDHAAGRGFRVRLEGDRTRIIAYDVVELQQAVEHYYDGHGGHRENCPLCRTVNRNRHVNATLE